MTSCEQFVRWLPSFEYVSSQVGSRSSGMCVCARCKHMFLFCSYNSIMMGQKLQEHRSGQNKSHNKHDFAVKTRLFSDQVLYQNIVNQPLPLQKKTRIDCEPAQSDFQTTQRFDDSYGSDHLIDQKTQILDPFWVDHGESPGGFLRCFGQKMILQNH